jgi:hypothetical protein
MSLFQLELTAVTDAPTDKHTMPLWLLSISFPSSSQKTHQSKPACQSPQPFVIQSHWGPLVPTKLQNPEFHVHREKITDRLQRDGNLEVWTTRWTRCWGLLPSLKKRLELRRNTGSRLGFLGTKAGAFPDCLRRNGRWVFCSDSLRVGFFPPVVVPHVAC